MTKKIHRYDIVDKNTNEVIADRIPTREWAREEKRFYKEFEGIDTVIRQSTYVLDNERIVR